MVKPKAKVRVTSRPQEFFQFLVQNLIFGPCFFTYAPERSSGAPFKGLSHPELRSGSGIINKIKVGGRELPSCRLLTHIIMTSQLSKINSPRSFFGFKPSLRLIKPTVVSRSQSRQSVCIASHQKLFPSLGASHLGRFTCVKKDRKLNRIDAKAIESGELTPEEDQYASSQLSQFPEATSVADESGSPSEALPPVSEVDSPGTDHISPEATEDIFLHRNKLEVERLLELVQLFYQKG